MEHNSSIEVYISGEDNVTKEVIYRILSFVSPRFKVVGDIPARGGEIKKKIPQCNSLAKLHPVIMLLDVDNGCAPMLKSALLGDQKQSDGFLMNIAVDEAEAWLMADTEGFARYFGINSNDMPKAEANKQGGRKALIEMKFSMKSSFVLTHELIFKSNNSVLKQQIGVKEKGKTKGKEYNDAIVPFIKNVWNIKQAKINSDSLQRMLRRLECLLNKY
ncbi:MAG: DUF4276 family protein [Prevotella sp.]|nr:DUF4276 family protein [Prevotella sp.]MDE6354232.1 DUF4276 family protein [Prevotella sp.]